MASGLERLWAGWRSEYVEGGVDVDPDVEGSLFQRIVESGLPDEETCVLTRGQSTFALLNAFPYTSGHLMVLPYRAVPNLEDLTDDEHGELWATVRDAVVAVKAAYRPEGVNVGLNLGLAAGAGVPDHLHVHVLPRWAGDTNFVTSVAELRVLPEALGRSWERLREVWPGG